MQKIISKHCSKRMAKRNISKLALDLCLKYGEKIHRTGITFYILLEKTIKEFLLPEKLEGLCVLVAEDNNIITVYKNKSALSKIKKLGLRKSIR